VFRLIRVAYHSLRWLCIRVCETLMLACMLRLLGPCYKTGRLEASSLTSSGGELRFSDRGFLRVFRSSLQPNELYSHARRWQRAAFWPSLRATSCSRVPQHRAKGMGSPPWILLGIQCHLCGVASVEGAMSKAGWPRLVAPLHRLKDGECNLHQSARFLILAYYILDWCQPRPKAR